MDPCPPTQEVGEVNIQKIAKAVVAVVGVIIVVANGLVDDGRLTTDEIVAIGTAIGVALGVYRVPNKKVV